MKLLYKFSKNLTEWCKENHREDLLNEWDEPNLEPCNVGFGSDLRVKRKCNSCG